MAYCLTTLVHEGLGHGGVCLLLGGKPLMLDAIFFRFEEAGLSMGVKRMIAAGGSLANLALAAATFAGLRLRRVRPGPLHYFLSLTLALNVLMPFGYLLISGLTGAGDWATVAEGLGPPLLVRGALVVLGGVLYFVVAPRIVMPALNVYLGRDPVARKQRARMIALFPYLTGGIADVIAGLPNPVGWKLVVVSAMAASFGGTSLLAWYPRLSDETAPERPAALPRSRAAIVLATVVFGIFVGVFGPGLKF